MDDAQFDTLTSSLVAGSRRRVLASVLGLGTVLGAAAATDAKKKKKKKKKKKNPPSPPAGPCSATVLPGQDLQAAINANVNGTVCLKAGTYVLPGQFGETHDLNLLANLLGAGPGQTILQGSGLGRGVIESLFVASLTGLTVTGGDFGPLEGGGGGILNLGSLTITNCSVTGNKAGDGGGIANGGDSQLVLNGCTITGNTAHRELPGRGRGGGVSNPFGTLIRTNTTISGNTSDEGPDCNGAGC